MFLWNSQALSIEIKPRFIYNSACNKAKGFTKVLGGQDKGSGIKAIPYFPPIHRRRAVVQKGIALQQAGTQQVLYAARDLGEFPLSEVRPGN